MSDATQPRSKHAPSTREEVDERVEFTAFLLGQRLPKGEIKRLLMAKYKNAAGDAITARTCETYLSRARALLVEMTGRPKKEHVTDAAAFYLTTIQSSQSNVDQKLRAQDALVRLYGLEAPASLTLKSDPEAPLQVNVNAIVVQAKAQAEAHRKARFPDGQPADTPDPKPAG